MGALSRCTALLAGLAGSLIVVVPLTASPASADPASSPELVPFAGTRAVSATWGAPSGGYHADATPAVDTQMQAGTPVYAAGNGRVSFTAIDNRNCNPNDHGGLVVGVQWCIDHGYNGTRVYITHPDGTSSRYLHLSGIQPGISVGANVVAGQQIAVSGNSGISTGPHLHYEERAANGSYKTPGSWVACWGSDVHTYTDVQGLAGQNVRNDGYACTAPAPPADSDGDGFPDSLDGCPSYAGEISGCPEHFVVRQTGSPNVSGKVGVGDTWSTLTSTDGRLMSNGNRIAVLAPNGDLFAKDGLTGVWVKLASNVADAALSRRMVLIRQNGSSILLGKEGLGDMWSTLTDLPGTFAVVGSRITLLTPTGDLWAKDGLGGTWAKLTEHVGDYAFSEEMVVVRPAGSNQLLGKAELGDLWILLSDLDGQFAVSGNRLAVHAPNGDLWAKEGLTGVWSRLADHVADFALGERLVVVRQSGSTHLIGKVGLGDTWTTLTDLSGRFAVSGNRLAVLTPGGDLWAKEGIGGVWARLIEQVATTSFGPDRDFDRAQDIVDACPDVPATGGCPAAPAPPALARPAKVGGVSAKAHGSSVKVRWSAPLGGVTEYVVKLGGKTKHVAAGKTRLVFRHLKPGKYKVTVVAVNAAGAAPASDPVKVRVKRR